MTSPHIFDDHMLDWKAEQQTPWFRLRYTTVRANLLRHFSESTGDQPLRILDVGGGNGVETLPLAALGHTVTLVDYSTEMLADARRNVEAAGVAGRMIVHEGDVAALPDLFPAASFDVALCHNVLQYVADPPGVLRNLADLVRPRGLLSIVSPNRYGETYLAALLQSDLATALDRLDATDVEANLFKTKVHRFSGEEMLGLLGDAGCAPAGHYGILNVCAYIPNNDLKYDPTFFAQLERLELALTARYPYYLVARFFQVIVRKSGSEGTP